MWRVAAVLLALTVTVGDPASGAAVSTRLLLPYFEVDTSDPAGDSTLFAVRNEGLETVDITIRYFETNRPQVAQRTDVVTLGPKEVETVQVRSVDGLAVDLDGFARGWVEIEADSEVPVIQGDYFQVTPGEDFATGDRLVDIDPESPGNGLCGIFSLRFFNGGVFSGGTRLILWVEAEGPLTLDEPLASYSVYDEAGELRFSWEIRRDEAAFALDVADLLEIPPPVSPPDFGVVELQLNERLGYLSATMSAKGRFSIGLGASCGDG